MDKIESPYSHTLYIQLEIKRQVFETIIRPSTNLNLNYIYWFLILRYRIE